MNLHEVADDYSKAMLFVEGFEVIDSDAVMIRAVLSVQYSNKSSGVIVVLARALMQEMYPEGISVKDAKRITAIDLADKGITIADAVVNVLSVLVAKCLSDAAYDVLDSEALESMYKG